MTTAFQRLHPKLQETLWRLKWEELRPIQVAAIEHFANNGGDALITAPTAGGKTEAAFLPVLSAIMDDPAGGVRALYVCPLKALINDQFARIERLCETLEIPVHRRHGDVAEGERKRLSDAPSGVLIITPESIEALFLRRPHVIRLWFSRLDFIVIDELHVFLESVRGAQLASLLARIERRIERRPTRIGLSATLGDPSGACQWLADRGKPAQWIQAEHEPFELRLGVWGSWLDISAD